jgi:hypothetical protein
VPGKNYCFIGFIGLICSIGYETNRTHHRTELRTWLETKNGIPNEQRTTDNGQF